MARTNHGSYSYLEFTLDPAAERLFRGPDEIKLRPKSFQVILYLLEHHGRLVTREELLQAIWGDVVVTDESITKCIAEIRKALGDEPRRLYVPSPDGASSLNPKFVLWGPRRRRHKARAVVPGAGFPAPAPCSP